MPIFKQPDLVGRVPPLKLTLPRLDRLVSEERGLSMTLLTNIMREKIEGRFMMNARLVDDAVQSGKGSHVRARKKSTIRFSAQ